MRWGPSTCFLTLWKTNKSNYMHLFSIIFLYFCISVTLKCSIIFLPAPPFSSQQFKYQHGTVCKVHSQSDMLFLLDLDLGLVGLDLFILLGPWSLTLDLSWLGIGLRTCSWLGTWLRTCSSWFGNGLGGGGFDLLTWDLFLAWDLTQNFLVLTWDSGLLCFGAWVLTCLSWLWIGFKNSGVVGLGAFLQ